MAVECAHCGTRAADGTTRCPQCLRATGLVQLPPEAASRRPTPKRIAAVVGAVVLLGVAGVGVAVYRRHTRPRGTAAVVASLRSVAARDVAPPLETGAELAPLVARITAVHGALPRARALLEIISSEQTRSGAVRVAMVDRVPPARSADAIYRTVRARDGRVTELDLSRLFVSVLRAAGTPAQVAERTRAPRPDEPADPSGMLGSYTCVVETSAIDFAASLLVPAGEGRPRALGDRALVAAMLAQSALSDATSNGRRDHAMDLANGAVDADADAVVPLAVRAAVFRYAGGSSGAELADRDLQSAIALRDDAPLHLLRARLALTARTLGRAGIVSELEAGVRRAPGWGPAALAAVIARRGQGTTDGGDLCQPLVTARDDWTDDALIVCRLTGPPDEAGVAAASRLMGGTDDPMRIAYAATGGARDALERAGTDGRSELAGWLSLLGRLDLAQEAVTRRDAGR